MKKRISLLKMTALVQMILLAAVVGIIFLVGIYFQRRMLKEEKEVRQAELAAQIRELDSRLGSAALQVKEILRSVVDSNGLWSEDSGSKYFDKIATRDLLLDKALVYADLKRVFVCRKDDFYIGTQSQQGGGEKLNYQDYVAGNLKDLTSDGNKGFWKIRSVDGIGYCFLTYHYADAGIYVGVGLRCDELFAGVNAFFENAEGMVIVTDRDGISYTEYEEDPSGTITVQQSSEQSGLSYDGYITVSALEFMQKSTFISMALLCVGSMLVQYLILRGAVVKPVSRLSDAVKNMAEESADIGQMKIEEDASAEEIYTLQFTLNYLLREVISARLQLYEKKMQEQDMELRQLRAQLRPHFYLNAIMTVSSMTYQDRDGDIREYLARLSDHMRYMMRIRSSMVSLKEELAHIENYVDMQTIKFPSSVLLMTECPAELEKIRVPHLILYTIVENAFKYAMNLKDTLVFCISCGIWETADFTGLRVILEDNGPGFHEEILKLYNGEGILEDNEGRHIGLSNVKRSLYLQYGRKDLLRLSNAVPQGARVEIHIPKEG